MSVWKEFWFDQGGLVARDFGTLQLMATFAKRRETGLLRLLRMVLRLVDVIDFGGRLFGDSNNPRGIAVYVIINLSNATKLSWKTDQGIYTAVENKENTIADAPWQQTKQAKRLAPSQRSKAKLTISHRPY
jgi:hypothetical protein